LGLRHLCLRGLRLFLRTACLLRGAH
jgi:hypothetical protein